jgi:hypothetical protein
MAVSVNLSQYIKRLFKHALSIITPAGTGEVTILSESETPITKDTYQAELQDRGITVSIDSPTSVTYNLRGAAESVPVSGSAVDVSVSGNAQTVTPVGASATAYTGTKATIYSGYASQTTYSVSGSMGGWGVVVSNYASGYSGMNQRSGLAINTVSGYEPSGSAGGYTTIQAGIGWSGYTTGSIINPTGSAQEVMFNPSEATMYQPGAAVTLYNAPTTKRYYNAPTNQTYYNDGGTLTLKQADRVGADPATVQYLETGNVPTASGVTDTVTEEI